MVNLNETKSIEEFVTCEFEIIFEQWNDPFDSIWLKIATIIVYAVEIFASLIMLAFVAHETRGLFGHYRTLINQLLSYLYGGVSNLSTGTPLIGRFLGPRKTRLNRNPSY